MAEWFSAETGDVAGRGKPQSFQIKKGTTPGKERNTMTHEQVDEKVLDEKVRASLAPQTTEQLLSSWELTETMPPTLVVTTVRGWLMDEFERRDPVAFNRWMDNDYDQHPEKDTPRAWFSA
mgnify:FL=1